MGTVYLNYGKIAIFWMQMHTDSQDLKENFEYRIRTPNVEGMHRSTFGQPRGNALCPIETS